MNRCVVILILLLAAGTLRADEPLQDVSRFLEGLDRFESTFEQSVQGPHGELIEYAAGQFLLERPRFRWQVQDPYPQIIVSDGEKLRIYDPDLEQVTERDLSAALVGTPLGLLARRDVDLAGEFTAEELQTDAFAKRYVLSSVAEDAPYRRIELWLDGERLLRIEVLDHFDQRLRVEFTEDLPAPLGETPFQLELPDTVEVVQG